MKKNIIVVLQWISIPIVTILAWILSFMMVRLISSLVSSEWYTFGVYFTAGLISAAIAVTAGFHASPKRNNFVLFSVAFLMFAITCGSFYLDNYVVVSQRLNSNLESIGQIIGIIIAVKYQDEI